MLRPWAGLKAQVQQVQVERGAGLKAVNHSDWG